MSMHPSLRVYPQGRQHIHRRQSPGQAWASARKRGLVPTDARPRCPRSHGRPGTGYDQEVKRHADARAAMFERYSA